MTGAAAQVLQARPTLTPTQLAEWLRSHAIPLGDSAPNSTFGAGARSRTRPAPWPRRPSDAPRQPPAPRPSSPGCLGAFAAAGDQYMDFRAKLGRSIGVERVNIVFDLAREQRGRRHAHLSGRPFAGGGRRRRRLRRVRRRSPRERLRDPGGRRRAAASLLCTVRHP